MNNKYKKAIHPFDWLLEKFRPVKYWHDEVQEKSYPLRKEGLELSRDILYFTDNQLNTKLAHRVQDNLRSMGIPIVSVSLKPMAHFGRNIHIPLKRGVLTYFQQILAGLEASHADIIYMCEHDVLYHKSHFDYTPPTRDKFYYNQNFWKIREDGFAVHWDANQVSGLVAYRTLLVEYYQKRIDQILKEGFNRSYEPGGRNSTLSVAWNSEFPNVDIRHKGTLTGNKWSPSDFRDKSTCVNWQESTKGNIKGWGARSLDFV